MITKGQRINERYEIIKSIGEGGMANVYLAKDIMLKRQVAIKVLRGDLANDEKFIRRFQREAISASLLSHPNIVEMYDVGDDNGNYYIVMEYIEGKTLKQLIKKRGNLTVTEAIDIMLQLTDGMAQAHDSYIIHRDLKPQNIMIQEDGQIKITDFGIAMALNSTQLTQTNSVMGSVHYLPPEQASGKGSTIKSDIYSMGILFYELLTGSLPFKGENAVEIALKQMKEQIPSVRKQFPLIPQSVENIIIKATAKNPKNRYNDVREMYNDLKTCMDEDKKNVPRLMFKYPEHDNDDTKKLAVKKEDNKEKIKSKEESNEKTGDIVKPIVNEEGKKSKIIILVLLAILLILLAIGTTFILTTAGKKVKSITVPDVSGNTVMDAEQMLTDKGFNVNLTTEKIPSDEYEEGIVIKTEPIAGRLIKEGTTITIYESTGTSKVILEDYKGKNYIEVQTKLKEVYGLEVEIKKKSVENKIDEKTGEKIKVDPDNIISQSPKKGEEVKKGDKVILYIPDFYDKYPDFVNEDWTIDDIKAFAEEYEIVLSFNYEESTTKKSDTVLRQNREAGSRIVKGVTLKITLAKNVTETEEQEESENEEETS